MAQPPQFPPGSADPGTVAALRAVDRLQRALRRGDRAESVELLRELTALRPPMGEQWLKAAEIAADFGEIGLAREAGDFYVESCGGAPAAQFRKVRLLAYVGAFEEALALLRGLPEDVPDRYYHAHMRGALALNLGEAGEARQWLEQAVTLRPEAGETWHYLALLVDFGEEAGLAERLLAGAPAMAAAPAEQRAFYFSALGKVHADRHEHALAFAAFARSAGDMKAATPHPYERIQDSRSAAEAVNGYDAGRIAAFARRQSEPTSRTIFVTGLPRSGTTLVEQVLTSHSAVSNGAEINRLQLLARDVDGFSWSALGAHAEKIGPPALARLWDHWLDERFPGSGRVVDKTNDTTRMLGLAASLLPDAPLVWLTRDPVDTAWSCFRSFFGQSLPWSNDLRDIAYHFRLEDQVMTRWREILGDRLLVVPYEEFVTEPAPWTSRLLAHCGLSDEPQVFAPHQNRRAVATTSVMQVRRPIGRQAIGNAEPYRRFLEPFIEAYYG